MHLHQTLEDALGTGGDGIVGGLAQGVHQIVNGGKRIEIHLLHLHSRGTLGQADEGDQAQHDDERPALQMDSLRDTRNA
jgi:hypothetical protein